MERGQALGKIKPVRSPLITAFIATDYVVRGDGVDITIRVGRRSLAVDRLLARVRADTCTFITAWNPYSTASSLGANRRADRELRRELRAARIIFFEGVGRGSEHAETSVLAFGLSRVRSAEIGRRYRQDAIVYTRRGRPAELIALRWLGTNKAARQGATPPGLSTGP